MSLKQSTKNVTEREAFDRNGSDCWRLERDRICLRVEMRTDEVFIFPYQQFLGAHHSCTTADETLKITLSTHEVTVTGRRLEKLLAALQDFAVDWIRSLPSRYYELGENRDGAVTSINIRAIGE